jgi:hypothetical protein
LQLIRQSSKHFGQQVLQYNITFRKGQPQCTPSHKLHNRRCC